VLAGVRLVPRALVGRQGAPLLRGEAVAVLAAGTDRGPLLGRGAPAAALRVARHQSATSDVSDQRGPAGVSSTATPARLSWSRIPSAAAQSLRERAAVRCSRASATRASTTWVRPAPPGSVHCGSSGSSPSTPSMARALASACAVPAASPAASALL